MQTFLPYADFRDSSAVLDDRRLGKQRVETFQILRALTWPAYAWKNHPAVRMWRGFVPALVAYGLANCDEWVRRGYRDTVAMSLLEFSGGKRPDLDELAAGGQLPPWLAIDVLHLSHQSSLLRKDPEWYRPWFPDVPDDLPYFWPPPLFPRWPMRTRGEPLTAADAFALAGFAQPRPGQTAAVEAVRAGADCIVELPAGAGATSTGILAGLAVPGRTLWVAAEDTLARGTYASARELPAVPQRPPPARPAKPAAQTARQAGPDDLAAMADESLPPEWLFARPSEVSRSAELLRIDTPGLLVVDRADQLGSDAASGVRDARVALDAPPLLALSRPLTEREHARLAAMLGVVDARRVTAPG
jgi:hypothetical protein